MVGRAAGQLTGLAAAYARLDDGQREAVDSEVSTVVIAGPGSGKTETLAIKAAILLQEIPAPRGVACITYTRAAARVTEPHPTAGCLDPMLAEPA